MVAGSSPAAPIVLVRRPVFGGRNMSVEQLIDLAKTLPQEDQLRLVEAIQEDRFTKMEREFGQTIRPGFLAQIWLPQCTVDNWESIEQELQKLRDELK